MQGHLGCLTFLPQQPLFRFAMMAVSEVSNVMTPCLPQEKILDVLAALEIRAQLLLDLDRNDEAAKLYRCIVLSLCIAASLVAGPGPAPLGSPAADFEHYEMPSVCAHVAVQWPCARRGPLI